MPASWTSRQHRRCKGENTVNEKNLATVALQNNFATLFKAAYKMHTANAQESGTFRLFGQEAKLVKGADGIRSLDPNPRAKLFDDAMEASIDKSRELQNKNRDGLTKLQEMAIGLEARHWSAATSCVMQLNQLIA